MGKRMGENGRKADCVDEQAYGSEYFGGGEEYCCKGKFSWCSEYFLRSGAGPDNVVVHHSRESSLLTPGSSIELTQKDHWRHPSTPPR